VNAAQARRLGQGQAVAGAFTPAGRVAVMDEGGRALGLGMIDDAGQLRPQRWFAWACMQPAAVANTG
jgi:tRNA pseudouridine55 synthase